MLPGWLWCVLAPLILVVGAAGVVAFSIGVFAGTDAVVDTLFGERLRARDVRRALRRERAGLDGGHWPPLVRLWQGPQPLAARWAPVLRLVRDGEVKRMRDGVWRIGVLADGTPLHFLHRAEVPGLDGRAFQIGEQAPISSGALFDLWGAPALRAALMRDERDGYRTASSVSAVFARAASFLGSAALPVPPAAALDDLEALLAFAAGPLRLTVSPPTRRTTLGEAFAAFVTRWRYEPPPTLADFADVFPEHAAAASWIALTDPTPGPSEDDASPPEPLTLYLASPDGPRIVALAFREDEPWIVADHRDAAGLLIDGALGPAIDQALAQLVHGTLSAVLLDATT